MALMDATEYSLTARWVFPVDAPPIDRGVVTVRGEQISAIGPRGNRSPDIDLGNAAILPGFVNAHTHLDLSGLRGQCPPSPDFTGWLRQVIAHRRTATPEQTRADIRAGLAECLRFGTTLVGDIASGGASWDALAEAPLRAVVYYELLGLLPERAAQAWTAADAWLAGRSPSTGCHPGLSPHAPYSVTVELLRRAASAATEQGLPLAIHLAETPAEMQFIESEDGPLASFLLKMGGWDAENLVTFPEEVCYFLEDAPVKLYAHGNFASPTHFVAAGGTVVYCPRTHAAFGHPPHPFRDFLAHGVRAALGTDSLASNPDLDLLVEARFIAARYPDLDGATLLRMATLSGAEALGWADVTGSLTPGKSADLVVLPLPDHDADDPHRLLFESDAAVSAVMFRGRWRERETTSDGGAA